MSDHVIITLEEYERLIRQDKWLDALNAAGVDNWEGYDYAREIFQENNPDLDE